MNYNQEFSNHTDESDKEIEVVTEVRDERPPPPPKVQQEEESVVRRHDESPRPHRPQYSNNTPPRNIPRPPPVQRFERYERPSQRRTDQYNAHRNQTRNIQYNYDNHARRGETRRSNYCDSPRNSQQHHPYDNQHAQHYRSRPTMSSDHDIGNHVPNFRNKPVQSNAHESSNPLGLRTDLSPFLQLMALSKSRLKHYIERSRETIYNLCIQAHNQNPALIPIPPLDRNYTNIQLQNVVWQWIKRYSGPGVNRDDSSDGDNFLTPRKRGNEDNNSSNSDEESKRRKTELGKRKRSDAPYPEYLGKADCVDMFRGNFTRKFLHFFLGLKKDIPTIVRDIFAATTRKPIRDPSLVETECLTLAYCLHAFLATTNDLETFMKKPCAVGLRYVMRRLYVLLKI